jgi:hypothetical protein
MADISYTRGIVVVLAAVLLLRFVDQTLEQTLVMALADMPVKDEASYVAIRNRPQVLAVLLATHAVAALLTGYVLAKLAGSHEVQHAAATAALVTLLLVAASAAPNVLVPPVWVLVAMAVITPPALIAGAYVRGQARVIRAEREE